jgi:DNA mismatch repair ATPase MutS
MDTVITNDIPCYKYKICSGISKIKGGITVLKELGYPEDIINRTKDIVTDF